MEGRLNRNQAERIVLGTMILGRSRPSNPLIELRSDWHRQVRAACVRAAQQPGGPTIDHVAGELYEMPGVRDDLLAMAEESDEQDGHGVYEAVGLLV